jgi:hypothetical protein
MTPTVSLYHVFHHRLFTDNSWHPNLADSIQSSPIQGSRSFERSLAGALVRRSTDASLVEGIEAGKLSVITEENEGQGREQTEPEGDETGEEFGGKLCQPTSPSRMPF